MSEEKIKNGSEVTKQDNQDKKDSDNKQPLGALLQMLNITHKSSNATLGGVIAEKMSQEQVPLFFKHVEKREMEEHKNTRLNSILLFFALVAILAFFCAIVFLFKDANIADKITTGLISFLCGGFGGFGIGKMQNKE
jgi:hypothetical protein